MGGSRAPITSILSMDSVSGWALAIGFEVEYVLVMPNSNAIIC